MLIKSVFQFLTNVLLTAITVLVFHASRVMTLKKELVSSHHSTMLNPLILDVPPGIGITKSALLALNNGLSMLIKFAFPSLTNALLTAITVLVFHASRVTILRKEPAFSLTSTMPSPLIQVAPPGIGITKNVFLAHSDGFSMLRMSAFPFLTNALLTTIRVTV
jgi:hypothetical protein